VLDRRIIGDNRGYLERLFASEELRPIIGERAIVAINRSMTSRRGTVRGMHFQLPPNAELKFITCIRGKVFDVAVDVRRNSSTLLQWHAEVLSEDQPKTFVIPEGFAHGFQALSDDCELLYFHTAAYEPAAESGLNPTDPRLAINWPEDVGDMSERDASHRMLTGDFTGVAL